MAKAKNKRELSGSTDPITRKENFNKMENTHTNITSNLATVWNKLQNRGTQTKGTLRANLVSKMDYRNKAIFF